MKADLACFSKAVANGMPLSVLTGRARRDAAAREGRLLLHDLRRRGAVARRRARRRSRELARQRRAGGTSHAQGARLARTATTPLAETLGIAVHAAASGFDCRTMSSTLRRRARGPDPLRDEVARPAGADQARRSLGRLPQPVASRTPTPTSTHTARAPTARCCRILRAARRGAATCRRRCAASRSSRSSARRSNFNVKPKPPRGQGGARCTLRRPKRCWRRSRSQDASPSSPAPLGLLGTRALPRARARPARRWSRPISTTRRCAATSRATLATTPDCGTRARSSADITDGRGARAALRDAVLQPLRPRRRPGEQRRHQRHVRDARGRRPSCRRSRTTRSRLWQRRSTSTSPARSSACQVLGAEMAKRGSGSIINIASTYGMVAPDQSHLPASPTARRRSTRSAAYPATKGAVLAFTRFLADVLGRARRARERLSPGGVENGQDDVLRRELRRADAARAHGAADELRRRAWSSWRATRRAT